MRSSRLPNTARVGWLVAWLVVVASALTSGCGSGRPQLRPMPVDPPTMIRGTEEAADSVPERVRTQVYRALLQSFFRPPPGQARWIDPQPLGEKRGTADSTVHAVADDEMPPDAGWAESVAEAAGLARVCVLGGAEDNCRGRPGGILRLSPVYAAGPGRVHVYARYTPHGGAKGPTIEQRFTLVERGDAWRITDHTAIPSPEERDGHHH